MLIRLKTWARGTRRDALALYLASRDPRVPWYAKTMALATAAYAFNPIDPIPDFIPVLGYLDELFVLPVFIRLTVRSVPADVMTELRAKADQRLSGDRRRSMSGAIVIVLVWISVAASAYFLIKLP